MTNKVGRPIGKKASKIKFMIEYYNKSDNKWVELGKYPSLRKASKELDLSYGMLSDLNIGRRKIYNNFYRITNIIKTKKDNLSSDTDDTIISIPDNDIILNDEDLELMGIHTN